MRKILLYPLWLVDELEKKLHEFEIAGWRLVSVKSCVFDFVKANSKDSDYIITYDMARDNKPAMYEFEHKLLSQYSADKINTKFTNYYVFRITGENRNFKELKNYRKYYFNHVLFQQMIISMLFLIVGLFMLVCAVSQQSDNTTVVLVCAYTILAMVTFLYRMYGYIKQKLK